MDARCRRADAFTRDQDSAAATYDVIVRRRFA